MNITMFLLLNSRKKLFLRLISLVIVTVALYVSYELARQANANLIDFGQFIARFFHVKLFDGDITRTNSNMVAITLIGDTWGLGVGLGSNRASSFILSMLSNIGVPGLVLFTVLVFSQSLIIFRIVNNEDMPVGIFILSGSLGIFLGMALGIPDINFPAWWIWLICGFGIVAARGSQGSAPYKAP